MEWEVLTGAIAAEHSNFLHRFWKGYRSTSKVLCLTQGSVWIGHSLVRSPLSVTMFPYRHKVLWSYKPWKHWARTRSELVPNTKNRTQILRCFGFLCTGCLTMLNPSYFLLLWPVQACSSNGDWMQEKLGLSTAQIKFHHCIWLQHILFEEVSSSWLYNSI